MADQFTYAKLPSDPCLTQEQMTAYIDGKLSAADQHACEKHILDCAMCEDALEGLTLVKDRSLLAIPFTSAPAKPETKVVALNQSNRKMWYAVAAILVLVLGSTLLIRFMANSESMNLAQNEAKTQRYDSIYAPDQSLPLPEGVAASDSVLRERADAKLQSPLTPKDKPMVAVAPAVADGDEEVHPGFTMNQDIAAAESVEEAPAVQNPMQDDADGATVLFDDNQTKQVADLSKQEDKKTGFWDKAKANIPSPASGATQSRTEQQTLVQGNVAADQEKEKDANEKPNAPPAAETPASPKAAGVGSYDYYNDSGVVFATTVSNQDTTKAATDNLELSYINGINLLAAGQPNAAISMFDKVLLDKNHARYEDAEFQKAKALIQANRKEEAKTLLKAIETKKGKHAAEATELLKTL